MFRMSGWGLMSELGTTRNSKGSSGLHQYSRLHSYVEEFGISFKGCGMLYDSTADVDPYVHLCLYVSCISISISISIYIYVHTHIYIGIHTCIYGYTNKKPLQHKVKFRVCRWGAEASSTLSPKPGTRKP